MITFTDIDWIFFDMGSTLVNEDPAYDKRIELTVSELKRHGKTLTADELYAIERGFAAEGIGGHYAHMARFAGAENIVRYEKVACEECAYEAAATVLKSLHGKYRIGIIANQTGGSVGRLKNFGLLDHIDFVYSSTEIGLQKPDPEFYRAALDASGAVPGKSVMVGDRVDNDILPAREAGMKTVRVMQGMFRYYVPDDMSLKADATIDDISALPSLFSL